MVLQYKVLRTRDLGPRNRDLEVRQSFSKLNTLDSSLIRIRIALRNIFDSVLKKIFAHLYLPGYIILRCR